MLFGEYSLFQLWAPLAWHCHSTPSPDGLPGCVPLCSQPAHLPRSMLTQRQGNGISKRAEDGPPPTPSIWHREGHSECLWNAKVTLSCTRKRAVFEAGETQVPMLALPIMSWVVLVQSLHGSDYPMTITPTSQVAVGFDGNLCTCSITTK